MTDNKARLDLAVEAEDADRSDQYQVLSDAFEAIKGPIQSSPSKGSVRFHKDWFPFQKMLKANAFESAAMTLLPEGWRLGMEQGAACDPNPNTHMAWCWPFESSYEPDWQMGQETQCSNPDGVKGVSRFVSMAMCAAILRAG